MNHHRFIDFVRISLYRWAIAESTVPGFVRICLFCKSFGDSFGHRGVVYVMIQDIISSVNLRMFRVSSNSGRKSTLPVCELDQPKMVWESLQSRNCKPPGKYY